MSRLKIYLSSLANKEIINDISENISSKENTIISDLNNLHPQKIIENLISSLPYLLNLAYQILIILLVIFLSNKIIKFLTYHFDKFLNKSKLDLSLQKFILSLFKAVSYSIVLLILASRVGIDSASIITIIGSIGLAIGLALQGSLSNFAGGILILVTKPFVVGDYIISEMGEGDVSMIGLIYTSINTYDNKKIIMPNGTLANGVITNLSTNKERMLELKLNLPFSSNIENIKNILYSILHEDKDILKNKDILIFVDSFSTSYMIIGIRAWCIGNIFVRTKWKIQEKIKNEFDKNNISFAFDKLEIKLDKDTI